MPWFVNWNDYRTTFEQQAGRILGHPVHVAGSARASILPSPSLTFTDVRVGDDPNNPMMTVGRFDVTVELMPLFQGQIRVVGMKLEQPKVRVTADATGAIDWLRRAANADALDPDKVVLSDVEISDGEIAYSDPAAGVAVNVDGINATVEATSLAGPWRVDGSVAEAGKAAPFRIATGRQLDDGTIRVKADFSPPQWPVGVSADGVLGVQPDGGLTYGGNYSVTEVVDAGGQGDTTSATTSDADSGPASGWASQGTYVLSRDSLVIDKAVLTNGSADRGTSLAGSLSIKFGKAPSFDALAEAQQLDLDRALGGGPTKPIAVADAAHQFVDWLTALPVPAIPGKIAFSVPGIVVGGSVIQDVAFTASPAAGGWQVAGFHASLPGAATIAADGTLTTDRQVGFRGTAHLAVAQPSLFASWWRGSSGAAAADVLSAFDIQGDAEITAERISVNKVDARLGDAHITGSFAWGATKDTGRELSTDLTADRIDFGQVQALANLLAGGTFTAASTIADSYSLRLAAAAFQFEDVLVKDVTIDAAYSGDVLNVVQFAIGDLGGASFKVTSGRIDALTTNPQGHLDARLDATTLDGLIAIVGKLAPGSAMLDWLNRASTVVAPAYVNARIVAPPPAAAGGFRLTLDGVAGATTFNAAAETAGRQLANWRKEHATFSAVLDSPDSAALARQFGLAANTAGGDTGSHVEIHGTGVPDDGLTTTVIADVAGLTVNASGALATAGGSPPSFSGKFGLSAADLDPFIALAGLAIPGAADGTKVDVDGTIATTGAATTLAWKNGTFADRAASGTVRFAKGADQNWRLDGNLDVDAVDLDWLMALGLGFSPLPSGDGIWPKTSFSAPTYGPVSGKITVATDHFYAGDSLDIAGGTLALALQPQQLDADLTGGHLAGGVASGGISIANVDGNANVSGRINLQGAALESLVWQRDDRPVATGVLDLSGSFQATGRSASGLVSSLTGDGVIGIHNGEARYVNPNAARLIIRASDLGQDYTVDALNAALSEQIDADSLHFDETGGVFSIAAGAARLKSLTVSGDGVKAVGDTVVDFNAMTLDSDWTLTFDPGDTKVEGTDPSAAIVFRGPLVAPTRTIDALPFSSYLNARRAARMLEIIAMGEADRAEQDRLSRLVVSLQQDKDRRERQAREAAEAAARQQALDALALAKVADLHVDREIQSDERAAAALTRAAAAAAAAKVAATQAAADADQRAATARDQAAAAAATLVSARADNDRAATALADAQAKLGAATARSKEAAAAAAAALAAAADADKKAAVAMAAEKTGEDAAAKADADKANAGAALATAMARTGATADDAAAAVTAAAAANAAVDAAGKTLTGAAQARDATAATLAQAAKAVADIQTAAAQNAAAASAAAAQADQAAKARDALAAAAKAAADQATQAANARDEAKKALALAQQTSTDADAAVITAQKIAADAASVATGLAAGDTPTADALAGASSAQATVVAANRMAAGRKASADHARELLQIANNAFQDADTAAAAATSKAAGAQTAFEAADGKAKDAAAAAARAAAANTVTRDMLSEKTAARDQAKQAADAAQAAAEQAGAAFNDAQSKAGAAADRVASTRATAKSAADAETAASAALARATTTAEAAASALDAATEARDAAVATAATQRQAADAANAAAVDAADALASATAAYDSAVTAANAAQAANAAAESASAAADTEAKDAAAAAAAADAEATARATDADLAAERAGATAPDTPPQPRPRKTSLKSSGDTFAGDLPLTIAPVQ